MSGNLFMCLRQLVRVRAMPLLALDALAISTLLALYYGVLAILPEPTDGQLWENVALAVLILPALVWWLVSDAAWLRLYLERDLNGWPWQFGKDEGRLFKSTIGAATGFGMVKVALSVICLPFFFVSLWAGEALLAYQGGTLVQNSLQWGARLAIPILGLAIGIRFWLAGPLSALRNRDVFFQGWEASQPIWKPLALWGAGLGVLHVGLLTLMGLFTVDEFRSGLLGFEVPSEAVGQVLTFAPLLYVYTHVIRIIVVAAAKEAEAETNPPVSPDGPDPAPAEV